MGLQGHLQGQRESIAATAGAEIQPPAELSLSIACHACGSIMVRSGACYKCMNCGSTSGCS